MVKFLSPDSHSDTSDSLLPVISENYFWEIPFAFKASAILFIILVRKVTIFKFQVLIFKLSFHSSRINLRKAYLMLTYL